MENKDTSQETVNLEQLTATFDAMSKYAFWVGVQRGVMSSMNTIMMKYVGMTMEDYSKRMVKPQLHQMAHVGQVTNLLASLLKETNMMMQWAEADAQKQMKNESEEVANEQ